jgi:hypothetical protein
LGVSGFWFLEYDQMALDFVFFVLFLGFFGIATLLGILVFLDWRLLFGIQNLKYCH